MLTIEIPIILDQIHEKMLDCQDQIEILELKLKGIKEQRVETTIQKDRLEEEIRTDGIINEDPTSSLMQNIVTNYSDIHIDIEEETPQV